MPKSKYALERGGEKSLEISYGGSWKNTEVRLNGNLIGTIPNRKELATGQIFQLSDGTSLKVQLVKTWSGYELRVLRNDKPLPGSSSDPATRLVGSSAVIYFFAGYNIVLGLIALIFQVEDLQTLSYGIISVAIGFIFLVLGFFTQRRSLTALIMALVICCLDIGLVLYSGFITALVRLSVPDTVFGLIASILQYSAFPCGFSIASVGILWGMGQGVGAINKLKKETSPTVS